MIAFLAMLPAFALGWAVVRLLAPHRVGFYGWIFEISLGIGVGAGLSSLADFALTWAGAANRVSLLAVELIALAIVGFAALRRGDTIAETAPDKISWIWLPRIAVALGILFLALDFSQTTAANPDGEWDAAGIWNLRARYLAGGRDTWRYAVSNQTPEGTTGNSHPGYPLLLSGFIARTWTILGDRDAPAPAALSLSFGLATLGLLCGALAPVSEALGLLGVLVLLSSESFISQIAAQYADIPVSFFVLATIALLAWAAMLDWPPQLLSLAGLSAGFAAWTKNEGLPFAMAAILVALWRAKLAAKWMAIGAAVPLAATLALKFFLVQGTEILFPKSAAQALTLIGEPSRWGKIIASFAGNVWTLGFWWAHPILLLVVLAFALGFVPGESRRWWLLAAPAALLAADFGIYLITMNDLDWHLNTSNGRLIVQVWPAVLFGCFLMLRAPAPAAEAVSKAKTKDRKKHARA